MCYCGCRVLLMAGLGKNVSAVAAGNGSGDGTNVV